MGKVERLKTVEWWKSRQLYFAAAFVVVVAHYDSLFVFVFIEDVKK